LEFRTLAGGQGIAVLPGWNSVVKRPDDPA
jgi:hypothetical protein